MSAGISIWSSLRHPTYLRLWLPLVSGCCVSAHEVQGSWALNSSGASALVLSWTLAGAERLFRPRKCRSHARGLDLPLPNTKRIGRTAAGPRYCGSRGTSVLRRELEQLSSDAGARLLRALGVKGHEPERYKR